MLIAHVLLSLEASASSLLLVTDEDGKAAVCRLDRVLSEK